MRKITFSQATQEAMAETMAKDPTVFAMGEDLARQGGIFGQFKGLPQQFPGRIIDTPISETFIIGGGVGAALAGARPVVDMHFADFIGVPMDAGEDRDMCVGAVFAATSVSTVSAFQGEALQMFLVAAAAALICRRGCTR